MDVKGFGYYLVDSGVGSLIFLTTATPHITIAEKNAAPTMEKKVLEVAEKDEGITPVPEDEWVDFNRVEAGDIVSYRITIDVEAGAQNYVLHDKMDTKHMSLIEGSIEVYKNEKLISNDENTVYYTINLDPSHIDQPACSFEITFDNTFLAGLHPDDVLTVYYDAYFVGTVVAVDDSPHSNTAWLTYGDNGKTVEDRVETASYGLEVLKYANENFAHVLGGAKFELYRDAKHTDQVCVHPVEDSDSGLNVYTVCNVDHREGDTNQPITVMTTPEESGSFIIYGVDMETYYLVEIEAPEGYNPLDDHVAITLNTTNMTTNRIYDVNVSNSSGSMLPSTGGIGTTIFYVAGGLLVVAAIVLLITRKRMGTAE